MAENREFESCPFWWSIAAKQMRSFGPNQRKTLTQLHQSRQARPLEVEKIRMDLEKGAPENSDGTINLVHYGAWQAKEMGRGE